MRIELQSKEMVSISNVVNLCEKAAAGNVDTIFVPPVYVSDAFSMLKQYKTNILTSVARHDDAVETKIVGIDKAAQEGVKEVLVCICNYDLHDHNWDTIEREISSLFTSAKIHEIQLWLDCQFHTLFRSEQAKICEMMPKGTGLRLSCTGENDIAFAIMCGVRHIALSEHEKDRSRDELNILEEAGVTQYGFYEVPKHKTKDLYINGEKQ